MPHPATDNIYWASVVKAETIAKRVGIPFEDLRIVNQTWASDPLTLLIEEEDEMTTPVYIKLTDTVDKIEARDGVRFAEDALKVLKKKASNLSTFDIGTLEATGANSTITVGDVEKAFKAGNQNPDPSVPQVQTLTWTPEFVEFIDWYLQDMAQRAYKASFWVASLVFAEPGNFDFTPTPEMVKQGAGIAMSVGYADNDNLCAYAYNGDEYPTNTMPGKRLSARQYDMLKNSAKTVQTLHPHIRACKNAGFKVHASIEDMHQDVLVGREMNKQNKERLVRETVERQLQANQDLVKATSAMFD